MILRPTTLSALTGIDPAPVDLAKQAYAENLPQISVAVLRTQIQEERDPAKKMELIRRLVDLLVTGGRYSEALEVIASQDAQNDPKFAFWKGVSLLGTGDAVTAKGIFANLRKSDVSVPGISPDLITLCLARSLRANN